MEKASRSSCSSLMPTPRFSLTRSIVWCPRVLTTRKSSASAARRGSSKPSPSMTKSIGSRPRRNEKKTWWTMIQGLSFVSSRTDVKLTKTSSLRVLHQSIHGVSRASRDHVKCQLSESTAKHSSLCSAASLVSSEMALYTRAELTT